MPNQSTNHYKQTNKQTRLIALQYEGLARLPQLGSCRRGKPKLTAAQLETVMIGTQREKSTQELRFERAADASVQTPASE